MKPKHLNQVVYRIEWVGGQPFVRLGQVTKLASGRGAHWRVDDKPHRRFAWCESIISAILWEQRQIAWSIGALTQPSDDYVRKGVQAICKLQRLQRRWRCHKRRNGEATTV